MSAFIISVDHTTQMLIKALKDDLAKEPPIPDADDMDTFQLREASRVHEDWAGRVFAWRLLIGVRLTNAALGAAP